MRLKPSIKIPSRKGEEQPPRPAQVLEAVLKRAGTWAYNRASKTIPGLGAGCVLGPRGDEPSIQQLVVTEATTIIKVGGRLRALVAYGRNVSIEVPKEVGAVDMTALILTINQPTHLPLPLTIYVWGTYSDREARKLVKNGKKCRPGVLTQIVKLLEDSREAESKTLYAIDGRTVNDITYKDRLARTPPSLSSLYAKWEPHRVILLAVLNLGAFRGVSI